MGKLVNAMEFALYPGQCPEVVNRELEDKGPLRGPADFPLVQFPPPTMGDRGVPFAWEFVCFLEAAELEGPDRRRKTSSEGGEVSDLAISGVGSVQCFLNLRKLVESIPLIMMYSKILIIWFSYNKYHDPTIFPNKFPFK